MYSVILGRLGTDSVVINLLVREPAVMGDREIEKEDGGRERERERERQREGKKSVTSLTTAV